MENKIDQSYRIAVVDYKKEEEEEDGGDDEVVEVVHCILDKNQLKQNKIIAIFANRNKSKTIRLSCLCHP